MFIVFEGIDGCGKSTLSELFVQKLKSIVPNEIVLTNEPNKNTDFGADIRNILKKYDGKLSDLTEVLLFYASRTEHIKNVILPALKENKIVVSDRYYYSSLAYQNINNHSIDIKNIHSAIFNNIKDNLHFAMFDNIKDNFYNKEQESIEPDIVFWIDTDIDVCMQRNKKADLKDMQSKPYFEKCRNYYYSLYKQQDLNSKTKIIKVNGNQSIDEILRDLMIDYRIFGALRKENF